MARVDGSQDSPNKGGGGGASFSIRLDHFLKATGLARSGGEAKHRIQSGKVSVNDELETRRSRKLVRGDRVTLDGNTTVVEPSSL